MPTASFMKQVANELGGDERCASRCTWRRRCWRAGTSVTGEPKKIDVRAVDASPAVRRVLAKLKFLRGTAFDVVRLSGESGRPSAAGRRVQRRSTGRNLCWR